MADLNEIQNRLQERRNDIENSLSGEKKRGIIFWYDADKEYGDIIDSLQFSCKGKEVKIIKVDSYIKAKYLVEFQETETNFLLYFPFAHPVDEKNPLLDIELYSELFNADTLGYFMAKCGIPLNLYDELRPCVDFCRNKQREDKFNQLFFQESDKSNINTIYKCMIAVCVGSKTAIRPDILFKLFENAYKNGFEDDKMDAFKLIIKSGLEKHFRQAVNDKYGYNSEKKSVLNFLHCLYFGAIQNEIPGSIFIKNYNEYTCNINSYNAYILLSNRAVNKNDLALYNELCEYLNKTRKITSDSFKKDLKENRNCLSKLTIARDFEKLFVGYCDNIFEEGGQDAYDKVIEIINQRSSISPWFDDFKDDYKILLYLIFLSKEFDNTKINQDTVDKMRTYYTKEGWKIDQNYRKLLYHYAQSQKPEHRKERITSLNNSYADWTNKLNDQWYKILKSEGYEENRGSNNFQKQRNFWNDMIDSQNGKYGKFQKVLVIISDAFRYEVAQETVEKFQLNLKGSAEISNMWGCVPAFTQLGMASVLPHETIGFTDIEKSINVSINGKPSDGIKNRNEIIQSVGEDNLAIKWDEFKKLAGDQQLEQIKNKKIIYVYHDVIDNAGEHGDARSFPNAVEECIEQLQTIVKKFTFNFNFTQILLTADHGFLYWMKDTEASDKTKVTGDELQSKDRFSILKKGATLKDSTLNVNLGYLGHDDLIMSTPRSNMIFSKQGAYKHYVHGGTTLQELVIPLISYHYEKQIGFVRPYSKLEIITPPTIITSREQSITLFQREALGDKEFIGKYRVVIIDKETGKEVSLPAFVDADSNSSNNIEERKTQIILHLLPEINFKKTYEHYYISIKPYQQDENTNDEVMYNVRISIGGYSSDGFGF